MAEHFRALSAVFPVIWRECEGKTQVLLHRRQHTGYQDSMLDISASGHVDEGETATMAAARECKEELGIDVDAHDLEFAHLSHRLDTDRTYYDMYFIVKRYKGEPCIMETDKCSQLDWFDMDALPDDVIPVRRQDLDHIGRGIRYSEKL